MPRSLRTLLTVALLLVATPVRTPLLFTAQALAKRPKAQACPDGRFVVPQNRQLIVGGAITPETDAVVVQGVQIAIGSGCPPMPGKVKATKKGTKVTDKWGACGSLQKVRLKALIEPDCNTMTGTLAAKKTKPSRFQAKRSFCGDGIIDQGGGEACDSGVGCADGRACTALCACVVEPGSTTTTLPSSSTSTITTATSTTTTIMCPAGDTRCAGMCVDTSNDPNNCGACGTMCLTGYGFVCRAGACGCPAGDTLCGSRCDIRPCQCIDVQNDPNNCGRCGNVCSFNTPVCIAGVCTIP